MSFRRNAMYIGATILTGLLLTNGCSQTSGRMGTASGSGMATPPGSGLALTGAQEVPPVSTQASGISTLAVVGDKALVGRVETKNIKATAAHIHQAPSGQNGPVVIPLVKAGDNAWTVAANTVLTSAQFDAYRAGNLYVNVHSAAHPNGEIRGQIKP